MIVSHQVCELPSWETQVVDACDSLPLIGSSDVSVRHIGLTQTFNVIALVSLIACRFKFYQPWEPHILELYLMNWLYLQACKTVTTEYLIQSQEASRLPGTSILYSLGTHWSFWAYKILMKLLDYVSTAFPKSRGHDHVKQKWFNDFHLFDLQQSWFLPHFFLVMLGQFWFSSMVHNSIFSSHSMISIIMQTSVKLLQPFQWRPSTATLLTPSLSALHVPQPCNMTTANLAEAAPLSIPDLFHMRESLRGISI